MLSYELGHRWANLVVEIYKSFPHWFGEQIFISELTQNLYFLGHGRDIGCSSNKTMSGGW